VKPVKGLSWGPAAIGNATWSGARLYDVLKAAGLEEDNPDVEHIQVVHSCVCVCVHVDCPCPCLVSLKSKKCKNITRNEVIFTVTYK
jgi:hypothetical protein